MSESHLRCEAARPSRRRSSKNGLANEDYNNRHYQNQKAHVFGHVAQKLSNSYVVRAYHLDFPSPRLRGCPPKKWYTQIREDTGLPLATAERRASERLDWRREVTGKSRFRRVIRLYVKLIHLKYKMSYFVVHL